MLYSLLAMLLDRILVKYLKSNKVNDAAADAINDFIDYIYCGLK